MYLLADAIKRAGATDAAAIQQAIKATKGYPGITGTITFGDSNIPQKGVTIIAIKDGKFTLGAEVVPQKVPAP
jgi:branched-chain amino acid transport system substrate-binding protein